MSGGREEHAYELSPVGLPGRDRVLVADGQVDRIQRDRVAPSRSRRARPLPRRRRRPRRRCSSSGGSGRLAVEEALVVRRVVLLVETGREAEIRQLDVAVLVDQDVVRLDVAARAWGVLFPRSATVLLLAGEKCRARTHRWMKPSLWTASIARTHSAM
jgi:hypothetical protein